MRSILTGLVMAVVVPFALAVESPLKADKADVVVALDIKGLKLTANRDAFKEPIVIGDEKALELAFKDKEIREPILKMADFKKHQLLYFAWSGSGGDKVTWKVEGDKQTVVVFKFTAGLTDDIRSHFQLFAIPRDATYKVEK